MVNFNWTDIVVSLMFIGSITPIIIWFYIMIPIWYEIIILIYKKNIIPNVYLIKVIIIFNVIYIIIMLEFLFNRFRGK